MDRVPVSRDPRYVTTCARVNCCNVKIGKARNLASRKRDYIRDFGEDNIRFLAPLATDEFGLAETLILRRLKDRQMRGPKSGVMDWLEGISVDQAIAAVFSALDEAGIPYVPLVEHMG